MNQGMITVFFEGRVRWTSPELLDWNYRPTKESDVYALGMVIYEVRIFIYTCPRRWAQEAELRQVLYGTRPFDGVDRFRIAIEVLNGTRPTKPEDAASLGFTSGLWEIVEQCWLADRNARPTLRAILSCLSKAAASWDDRRKGV